MSQYLAPNEAKLQATIKHVVVLMLENRSFDNLLGWLYSDKPPYDRAPDGQDFEGLRPDLWNPLDNIDSDGITFTERVPVERNGEAKVLRGKRIPNPTRFTLPNPDPGEGFKDTNHQLFGKYDVPLEYPPPCVNTGFVNNYKNAMLYGTFSFGDTPTDPRAIMKCYTPQQTPVLSTLARSFAVLDHYHCSVPSQTIPNRDFVHAATSEGHVNNEPVATCDAKTIFNQIQEAIDAGRTELSWGIFGNNAFVAGRDAAGRFGTDHFSLTRLIMTRLHDARFDSNFGTLGDFATKCRTGELPSYSFLEPNYGGPDQNDQHPPSDIRSGEKLIADLYDMIKASPAFSSILFVITYDEHGGCYDHVPPPGGACNPTPDGRAGQQGFLFNRFGVRVPCVVVNPHIRRGLVGRPKGFTPFDHTSVIRTVLNCFRLEGSLTARDHAAPDFSCLLTLDTPRTDDIPTVRPLEWDIEPAAAVNNLHRLISKVLGDLSRHPVDESADLLEYIQETYNQLFGGSSSAASRARPAAKAGTP